MRQAENSPAHTLMGNNTLILAFIVWNNRDIGQKRVASDNTSTSGLTIWAFT